ncbi:magnesium transporter [Acholeplasma hippikon]|nr:magnesium transporter [Acholeplasma hippikon]
MIKELLDNKASKEEIIEFLSNYHAYDISKMIEELSEEDRDYILDLLNQEVLAEVISYLNPEDRHEVFSNLTLDEQVALVEELEPDDAADIINQLEEEDKQELIKNLDEDEEVLDLIKYDEDEAGSFMTNQFVIANINDDVKMATKKLIQMADEVDTIQTIFVVDDEGHYKGQIPLKKLIKTKYPKTVLDILEVEPTFYVFDHVDNLVRHLKHYGGYDIGIVDNNHKLIGMIAQDDILDIYLDEAQEDYEKLAALPDTSTDKNAFLTALHRLPWLLILLAVSIPSAFITSNFTGILTAFVILAFFQPLILDAGGDVASQTLAVTLIEMTKKDAKVISNGLKEIATGAISGFVMGVIAFAVTLIFSFILQFDHGILIGLSVGLSLWLTVITGPFLGFMIPFIISKMKFDPAVASGPFITNLIDISSNLIYFGIATLILGGLAA